MLLLFDTAAHLTPNLGQIQAVVRPSGLFQRQAREVELLGVGTQDLHEEAVAALTPTHSSNPSCSIASSVQRSHRSPRP